MLSSLYRSIYTECKDNTSVYALRRDFYLFFANILLHFSGFSWLKVWILSTHLQRRINKWQVHCTRHTRQQGSTISPNSSDTPRQNPDTWHISDANPTGLNGAGILARLITTLTPESPNPCTIWRQLGNWREKERWALPQDKQRPVLYSQVVAVPSPLRHGADEVQTTRPLAAAQLSLQPRRCTSCKCALSGKRKEPGGRNGLHRFLEAPEVIGCTPTSFSRVSKRATTRFPQRDSEQNLLKKEKRHKIIICCYNPYLLHHCFSLPTQLPFSHQKGGFHQ